MGRDVEDMFHDRKMRIKIPQLKSRDPEDMDEMLACYGSLGDVIRCHSVCPHLSKDLS